MINKCKNIHEVRVMITSQLKKMMTLFVLLYVQVSSANEIKDIDFNVISGDRVEIRVKMDTPPPAFKEMTTDNPARIWMDFNGVSANLDKKTQTIGVGVTRSVTAVQAGDKTRLVVNLSEMVPYTSRVENNDLILVIGGSKSSNSNNVAISSSEPFQGVKASSLTGNDIANIDFRRGEAGEGRIIIEMNNNNIGIDLRQEGEKVLADFVNAKISNDLIRKLDVVDFATPAKIISTSVIGNNVRITVETLNDFEYLAYQAENTYTIELKPLTKEEVERKKLSEPVYSGQRLSLNFQDIPVRSVLSIISEFTGINIVTSDTVTGSITLRLDSVPWDQALDIVLKTKGLDKRQNGNVMLVAPADEIAARETLELQTEKQIEQLSPLRSEFIQVNYAKAEDLVSIIKTKGANYLSDRGSISVDERTNFLLVQDTAKKLESIRSMIRTLDVPVRQVLIESRVVVADDGFDEEIGVRMALSGTGARKSVSGDAFASKDLYASGSLDNRSFAVNMPVINPAGSIGMTIGQLTRGAILDLELSALETENRGEVIASPHVITTNQKEAYIEAGEEIPYLQASSAGNANITFKKAVLSLKVTPQITPDDRIILDLQVNQDSRGEDTISGPAINTREVNTQVLVKNGDTVVLGGVYQQRINKTESKVPILGDLPLFGGLFRSTKDSSAKQELLIFVTPKIINGNIE